MKKQIKKSAYKILLILLFGTNLSAQNRNSNFEIKFYFDQNQMVMENANGNNWNSLSTNNSSFYLNQNGMVNMDKDQNAEENSNYILAVTRKGKKVTLVGKKGTKWENLDFELPKKGTHVLVDLNGIKKL